MRRRAVIALGLVCACRWDVVLGADGLAVSGDAGRADAPASVDVREVPDVRDVPDAPDARDAPDAPEGPSGTLRSVALGGGFTCVVRSDDSVWCWGDNAHGALGAGDVAATREAVRVRSLGAALSVVAGRGHACALLRAGGVRCWGANDRGQLGDGTTVDRPTPVAPEGVGAVDGLCAGADHTCVRAGEAVRCAGANDRGQLGDGTTADRAAFAAVAGRYRRVEAGGAYTVAETAAGTLAAWGANDRGQLGDGTTVDRATPGAVAGAAAEGRLLAVGDAHALARAADGTTFGWGDGALGALGDGATAARPTPAALPTWDDAPSVRAGRGFTCGELLGGLRCAGANDVGQLGDGTGVARGEPVGVADFGRVGVLFWAAGFDRACAATAGDALWCWGDNARGQIGPTGLARHLRPALVAR